MMTNHVYNLMAQLTEEHKSLWRIKAMYVDEAETCEECKNFWKKMVEDKENHISELENLLKKHL